MTPRSVCNTCQPKWHPFISILRCSIQFTLGQKNANNVDSINNDRPIQVSLKSHPKQASPHHVHANPTRLAYALAEPTARTLHNEYSFCRRTGNYSTAANFDNPSPAAANFSQPSPVLLVEHSFSRCQLTIDTMADAPVTLRTRKFIRNPLLGRRQMVV